MSQLCDHIMITHPIKKWFVVVAWNKRRQHFKKCFFSFFPCQLMRHLLTENFHFSNLLQMPNDHRMANVWFFGSFCSCKRISFNNFFFANDLLLAIYFIFILDSRNDVTQKANFFCWLLSVVYCQLLMASHRTCHLQDSHVLCKTC